MNRPCPANKPSGHYIGRVFSHTRRSPEFPKINYWSATVIYIDDDGNEHLTGYEHPRYAWSDPEMSHVFRQAISAEIYHVVQSFTQYLNETGNRFEVSHPDWWAPGIVEQPPYFAFKDENDELLAAGLSLISDFAAAHRWVPLAQHEKESVMEDVTDVFIDGAVNQAQSADLNLSKAVIDAFWGAVARDAQWGTTMLHPLECCVLSALAIRDIILKIGRRDAVVMRTGLSVRLLSGRDIPYALTIGSPQSWMIAKAMNAHMVVRVGDLLIDPTIGQAKRDWNELPRSAIFKMGAFAGESLDVVGTDARVTTRHRYWRGDCQYQVAYFKLPYRADRMSRNWRSSPDAADDRRRRLVYESVVALQASMLSASLTSSGS